MNIKKQFQKSLHTYSKNAIVQSNMGDNLVDLLSKYNNHFDNILELGCGTGNLTKKILQKFNCENYYANDFVEEVKEHLPQNVKFIPGDMNDIDFPLNFDLVISNAVFQWFDNLEFLINKIHNSLSDRGFLAFSTFSPENFQEIKTVSGLSLPYKTEKELIKILSNKFNILEILSYKEVLCFETPIDLLRHMKNTGVNSLNNEHWGRKKINEFCEKYNKKYPQNTLTYAPIIVISKKCT